MLLAFLISLVTTLAVGPKHFAFCQPRWPFPKAVVISDKVGYRCYDWPAVSLLEAIAAHSTTDVL